MGFARLVPVLLAAGLCACAASRGGGSAGSLPRVAAGARPERLVVVSIYGLGPAAYLPASGAPDAPVLAALAAAGIAGEALRPVFPAAPVPAHVTLVTGRTPARHGIATERPAAGSADWDARAIKGRTLWQGVAEAGATSAALGWPASAGAGLAELPAQVAALPQGAARDAAIVEAACGLLGAAAPPRLLLLRLAQTEPALRLAAPGSPAARAAFASADREVGRLVACLRRAGRLASTALVVAGDRGVAPAHTGIRPNTVLAGIGLAIADPTGGLLRWDALVRSNGGSAFVYARDADAALLARRALEDEAARSGAFRLLSAEEMLARGADPEAWFGLETRPGFVFEEELVGALLAPAAAASAGGYAPQEPSMAAGFVAWGPGFRSGLRVPELQQVDVAPTLARLLEVPLDGADGHAMIGLVPATAAAPPRVVPVAGEGARATGGEATGGP